MNTHTGNFITEIGGKNAIEAFQDVGFQILKGIYIDKKFKEINKIIEFKKLYKSYSKNISSLSIWDICYYRICETEATNIITFLNEKMEIICNVETIPEKNNYFK